MTVQEFKEKYPHLAHLEGDALWDAMAESMTVPYEPQEGDDEVVMKQEFMGNTYFFTKGFMRHWNKFMGGEKPLEFPSYGLLIPNVKTPKKNTD